MPPQAHTYTRRIPDFETSKFKDGVGTSDQLVLMVALFQTSGFPTGIPPPPLRSRASLNQDEISKMRSAITRVSKCNNPDYASRHMFACYPITTNPNRTTTGDTRWYHETAVMLTDFGLEYVMFHGIELLKKKLGKEEFVHYQDCFSLHEKKMLFPYYQPLSTSEIMHRLLVWYVNGRNYKNVLRYMYANPGWVTIEALWNIAQPNKSFGTATLPQVNKISTEICHLVDQSPNTSGKGRSFRLKVDCFAFDDHRLLPDEYTDARNDFIERLERARDAKTRKEESIVSKLQLGNRRPTLMHVHKVSRPDTLKYDLLERCALRCGFIEGHFPQKRKNKWSAFSALCIADAFLGGSANAGNKRKRDHRNHNRHQLPLDDLMKDFCMERIPFHTTFNNLLRGTAALPGVPHRDRIILLKVGPEGDNNQSYHMLWARYVNPPNAPNSGIMFPNKKGEAYHIRNYDTGASETSKKSLTDQLPFVGPPTVRSAYLLYKQDVSPQWLQMLRDGTHPFQVNVLRDRLQATTICNHVQPHEANTDPLVGQNWEECRTQPFSVLCIGYRTLRNKSSETESEVQFSAHMSVDDAIDKFSQEIEATDLTMLCSLADIICGENIPDKDISLFLVGVSCLFAYNIEGPSHLTDYHLTNSRKTYWFLWAKNKNPVVAGEGPEKLPFGGILFPDASGTPTQLDNCALPDETEMPDERTKKMLVNELITHSIDPLEGDPVSSRVERRLNCEAIYSLKLREVVEISSTADLVYNLIERCALDADCPPTLPIENSNKFSISSAMNNAYRFLGGYKKFPDHLPAQLDDQRLSLQSALDLCNNGCNIFNQRSDDVTSFDQIIDGDNLAMPSENCVLLLQLGADNERCHLLWVPYRTPGPGTYRGGLLFPTKNGKALDVRYYTDPHIGSTERCVERLRQFLPLPDAVISSAYFLHDNPPPVTDDLISNNTTAVITPNELCTHLRSYFQQDQFEGNAFVPPEQEAVEDVTNNTLSWEGMGNKDPFGVICIAYRTLFGQISPPEADKVANPTYYRGKMSFEAVQDAFKGHNIKFTQIDKNGFSSLFCCDKTEIENGQLYCVGVSFLTGYDQNQNEDRVRALTNSERKTLWFLWARKNERKGTLFPDSQGRATTVSAGLLSIGHRDVARRLVTHLVNPWESTEHSPWVARRMKCEAIYEISRAQPNGEGGE